MNLSRMESETGINYNDEESFAIIYTANAALKRKLNMLCKLHPGQFKHQILIGDDEEIQSYHIPKKCVFIKTPSVISEEDRLRRKERGHRLQAKYSKTTVTIPKKTG